MVSQRPNNGKTSHVGVAVMFLVTLAVGFSMWWANAIYADTVDLALVSGAQNTAVSLDWLTPMLLAAGIIVLMSGYVIWRRR